MTRRSWAPILAILLMACPMGVPGDPTSGDSAATGDSADTTGLGDSTPADDSGDPSDNPFDVDDDGDGYSENQGDCDDADPLVFPGARDDCDGEDTDCDGTPDEDAVEDDPYEPNDDTSSWSWIGSLADDSSLSVAAWLHNDDDVDHFRFYVDDPLLETFGFTVTLSNIPSDANFQLTVGRLTAEGSLDSAQEVFGPDQVSVEVTGEAFSDDGGDFGVIVEALGGADCSRSYLLTVVKSG